MNILKKIYQTWLVFCEWRICWSIILQKRLTKWDKWIFSSFSCFSKFERKCLWSEILYLFLLFECCRTANFRTLALCHSFSKRTNIIYKVYYTHFKWRTIFKSVLKNKPTNRKIKSIMNPSINNTYPLKNFWSKFTS